MSREPLELALHVFPTHRNESIAHWEHHQITSKDVFYHQHPQFEINLIETGSARRVAGDRESLVRGRELILIGPYIPHRWHSIIAPSGTDSSTAEFWVVAFSRSSLGETLLNTAEFGALQSLLDRAESGLVFGDGACREAAAIIKSMGGSNGLSRVRLLLELFETLSTDAEAVQLSGAGSSVSSSGHRAVNEVVAFYMDRDRLLDQARPSLEEAAEIARMSIPSFTRLFRRVTGDSFVSYVTRLRITRACALLEQTDQRIAGVAAECGFGNLSHFNRQFKRVVGRSPRDFRETINGGERLPPDQSRLAPGAQRQSKNEQW